MRWFNGIRKEQRTGLWKWQKISWDFKTHINACRDIEHTCYSSNFEWSERPLDVGDGGGEIFSYWGGFWNSIALLGV